MIGNMRGVGTRLVTAGDTRLRSACVSEQIQLGACADDCVP